MNDSGGAGERVTVEVRGLDTFGPHGVTEAEREAGCRVLIDIAMAIDAGAAATDDIDGTVDYGAVARLAAKFVAERSFHTLERLCAALADDLEAEFGVTDVRIRAAKPEPPMDEPVTDVAVTLVRGNAPA